MPAIHRRKADELRAKRLAIGIEIGARGIERLACLDDAVNRRGSAEGGDDIIPHLFRQIAALEHDKTLRGLAERLNIVGKFHSAPP
jgi:hypothetical protein